MKYLYIIIIVFSQCILSQKPHSPSISGIITDADTKEPLAYANIFIANSSIGCASDNNGYFEIKNLPFGSFEIVASVIGYEINKTKIDIVNTDKLSINFKLKHKAIPFPEVTVTTKDFRKRKQQLAKFRKNFLGVSQNSKKTYINNEDVIQFNDDEFGVLKAFANEPLEIINNSLGYSIYYILEDFELTLEHVRYTGYPHFVELTATSYYDSIEWAENREWTYTGSLRHFLTTICENYEITQGDSIERATMFHFPDVMKYRIKVTYRDTTHIEDQGFYVLQVDSPFSKDKAINRQLVNTNWFLIETDNPIEMNLKFDNYLEVYYDNEFFPFKKRIGSNKKISWINIVNNSTILDKQGRYYDIYSIETSGIWSKERVADMLPFDYTIDD